MRSAGSFLDRRRVCSVPGARRAQQAGGGAWAQLLALHLIPDPKRFCLGLDATNDGELTTCQAAQVWRSGGLSTRDKIRFHRSCSVPEGTPEGGQVTSPLLSTATPRPRVPPRGPALRPWGRAGLPGTRSGALGIRHDVTFQSNRPSPVPSRLPPRSQRSHPQGQPWRCPPARPRPRRGPAHRPAHRDATVCGSEPLMAAGRGAGGASNAVRPNGVCWFLG